MCEFRVKYILGKVELKPLGQTHYAKITYDGDGNITKREKFENPVKIIYNDEEKTDYEKNQYSRWFGGFF